MIDYESAIASFANIEYFILWIVALCENFHICNRELYQYESREKVFLNMDKKSDHM